VSCFAAQGLVVGAMQGLYLYNPAGADRRPSITLVFQRDTAETNRSKILSTRLLYSGGPKAFTLVKTSKQRRFTQLNVLEPIGQLVTICGSLYWKRRGGTWVGYSSLV